MKIYKNNSSIKGSISLLESLINDPLDQSVMMIIKQSITFQKELLESTNPNKTLISDEK